MGLLLLYYLALAGVWKESSWLYNDITAICGKEEVVKRFWCNNAEVAEEGRGRAVTNVGIS